MGQSHGTFDVATAWQRLVKSIVARFARGNIPAQNAHILFPSEQDKQREGAVEIASKMRKRKHAA